MFIDHLSIVGLALYFPESAHRFTIRIIQRATVIDFTIILVDHAIEPIFKYDLLQLRTGCANGIHFIERFEQSAIMDIALFCGKNPFNMAKNEVFFAAIRTSSHIRLRMRNHRFITSSAKRMITFGDGDANFHADDAFQVNGRKLSHCIVLCCDDRK